MTAPMRVFNQYAGLLGTLDGQSVGVALVDDSFNPSGVETTVDSITGEVTGGGYARTSFTASFSTDDNVARVSEGDEWPTLDTPGHTGAVTYNNEPMDDRYLQLISFIPWGTQPATSDWLFQPLNGFARATPGALLDARTTALEGRTVAGVPFTADDVPVAALAAALSLETVGGTVDAVPYDLTGETPGAVTLDLTAHPVDKAGASVLMPVGSGQTLVITPPDPATHGHIDLDVAVDGSVTVSIPDWPVEVASVVVDGAGVVLASLAPIALADDSSAYSLVPSGTNVVAGGGGGGAAGADVATETAGVADVASLIDGGAESVNVELTSTLTAIDLPALPTTADGPAFTVHLTPASMSPGSFDDVSFTVDGGEGAGVIGSVDLGGGSYAWQVKPFRRLGGGFLWLLFPLTDGTGGGGGVEANSPITGDTKTKITYDAKGLVTAGADATTADIADSSDKRYVTDAELVVLAATSGANTGDATTTTEGALIHGATGKTTPVDADELGLVDSAASNILKKLTWANLKATLKTYFDTLYPSGSGTSSGTNTGDQTITLTGDVTGSGTGSFAATIGSSKVTSAMIVDGTIVNADLANMANKTYRGRHTAGSGVPEDVSVANVMADLSGAAAADFSLNSHKLTSVTDPSSAQDAATKNYVDTTTFWPRRYVIIPAIDTADTVSGTFTSTQNSGAVTGGWAQSAVTNDQSWTWNVAVSAGTWELALYTRTLTSTGIITVTLGGSSLGTIDTYAGVGATNVRSTISGFTISAAGYVSLVLTNPTKNASSTAYVMAVQSIILRRTGA